MGKISIRMQQNLLEILLFLRLEILRKSLGWKLKYL